MILSAAEADRAAQASAYSIEGPPDSLRDEPMTDSLSAGPRAQNSSCPAVNLPTELLAEIFAFACLTGDFAAYGSLRRTRGAISLTCHRWRAVTLATPILWTTICMTCCDRVVVPPPFLIPCEVERAGNRPLDVYAISESNKHWSETVFPFIRSNLDRCRQIQLSAPSLNGLERCFPCHAPRLETLILNWGLEDGSEADSPLIDVSKAPLIHDLYISYRANGGSYLQLRVPPASSITRLALVHDIPPSLVIAVVNSCPELSSLDWVHKDLSLLRDSEALASLPTLQTLPHLQDLFLGGDLPFFYVPKFAAPHLQSLALLDISDYNHIPRPDFHELRFPELRRFTIPDEPPRGLIPFLEAHHDLEEIALYSAPDEILISRLGAVSGSGYRFALLKRVIVEFDIRSRRYVRKINNLLRMRSRQQLPFQPLTLHICFCQPLPAIPELRRVLEGTPEHVNLTHEGSCPHSWRWIP